ncbi:MAG TPA: SDR family oxidoreductase [Candidatus Acidoferrum sp.]|nr:SDR family oxidoreductase [Candidatus Acidoferrum sp.]
MPFHNKIAVVLGGNSGIGLATARQLFAKGATVAISGRDPATLAKASAELGNCLALACDIADPVAQDRFYAEVKNRHGHIDILVVNAGVGSFAPVRALTPELWDSIHSINLRGCFFAAQKGLALMGKGGNMVFTGSIASELGLPGNCAYASAKAGLRAVVRNMAKELVTEGIRVNMVSPGPTETPIINRNKGMSAADVEALRNMMTNAVPMKRMGDADEIANAIVFLASSVASFITGVDLYVDGGCVEIG